MNSKVLAVVPVYKGEPKVVIRSISSLLSQDYPYLRIIILDDASKEDLLKTLQNTFNSFSEITWIENESNMGFANTLNKAFSFIVDEAFFFVLEQDCELASANYLTSAIKHFDDPRVGLVSGENTPNSDKELTIVKRVFMRHLCEDTRDSSTINTGFSLLKADVFRTLALQKVNGFESAANWKFACEEHMISFKLKSFNYTVVKDSQLRFKSYSSGQENLRQNLRKEAVYGRGLGCALARRQTNLDVGESKQLKTKKIGRVIQTLYVAATIISLFFYFLSPLLTLTTMLLAASILFFYLVSRLSAIQKINEKMLFLSTGFMRPWIYVPNFIFGFFYGLISRVKERLTRK